MCTSRFFPGQEVPRGDFRWLANVSTPIPKSSPPRRLTRCRAVETSLTASSSKVALSQHQIVAGGVVVGGGVAGDVCSRRS